jgi:hypothetical protein
MYADETVEILYAFSLLLFLVINEYS